MLTLLYLQCAGCFHGVHSLVGHVEGQVMAAVGKNNGEDMRRNALSPRLKGRGEHQLQANTDNLMDRGVLSSSLFSIRLTDGLLLENAKDTLCRNVTIYGKCRYEDKGKSNTRYAVPVSDGSLTGCAFIHGTGKSSSGQNTER